jgi:hypothetical protein
MTRSERRNTIVKQLPFEGAYPLMCASAAMRGAKSLPKRVILNRWGEYSYGYARDRFRDMVNALAALRGQGARIRHGTSARRGCTSWRGRPGTIRRCRGIGGRAATAGMIPTPCRS